MSRQDPGAATGQGVYPPIRMCVCGQTETVHTRSDSGARGGCPQSGCKRFEASGEVVDPLRCGVCGAAWSAIEAARRTP